MMNSSGNPNLTVSQAFKIFERSYISSLIVFGVIGNLSSAVILVSTKLRKLCSSIHLTALAISDTCFLLVLSLIWIPAVFNQPLWWRKDGICQFVYYGTNVFGFYSTLLVVSFTIERYIVTKYPLSYGTDESHAKSLERVISLFACSLLYYIYLPFATKVDETGHCQVFSGESQKIMRIIHSYDICFIYLLPTVLIILLNVSIGKTLFINSEWKRQNVMSHGSFRRNHGTERQITQGLMIISITFALLNLPYNICVCIRAFSVIYWGTTTNTYGLASLASACYYTNFALDFFLYHLASKNYRKAARTLSVRLRKRLSSTNENVNPSSLSTIV